MFSIWQLGRAWFLNWWVTRPFGVCSQRNNNKIMFQ